MVKVIIVACESIRQRGLCPGDAKCLLAAKRKHGQFQNYEEEVEIVGIVDCGGCPGDRVLCPLAILKMQLSALNASAEKIHVGTCIMKFCPNKDKIIQILKEKSGLEVIEGTHTYGGPTIF